jgi:superfamily I DNA/RNA helicase
MTQAASRAGVVCDEVQDASAYELRLLAALAPVELFLVGDGHQRLRERPTSLRACGIEVRGRSARLKLNYRTTQGICAAALEALEGVEVDVLDHEATEDGASDLDGYRSIRAGERPKRHAFGSADQEADFIASEIRASSQRPFLVLARTKKTLSALADKLRARGVTCMQLADADAMPQGEHVVLATLHRSKGLEAPRVILAAMQEVPARFPGGTDPASTDEDKQLWQRKERLLVYVGMTRARDACTLTSVSG